MQQYPIQGNLEIHQQSTPPQVLPKHSDCGRSEHSMVAMQHQNG